MNLVAYGSLMHPSQFAALSPDAAIPVWVNGFRRAFDQRPMWRGNGAAEHAVLAVRPDPATRFNGVLLLGIAAEWTPALDHRERGYIRTSLSEDQFAPFDAELSSGVPREAVGCEVYVGRAAQLNPAGVPLADYLTLCRQASAAWGEAFADAFEQTTRRIS